MNHAKGLQFRAVVVLFADLPEKDWEQAEARRLFHVALTRAEDFLAVFHRWE